MNMLDTQLTAAKLRHILAALENGHAARSVEIIHPNIEKA